MAGTDKADFVIRTLARHLLEVRRARAELAEQFETELGKHPDGPILMSLPGVGCRTAAATASAEGSALFFVTSSSVVITAPPSPSIHSASRAEAPNIPVSRLIGRLVRSTVYSPPWLCPYCGQPTPKGPDDLAPEERGVATGWDMPIDRPMPRTRAPARELLDRRRKNGDGGMEAFRVLKRRLSDVVFRATVVDQSLTVIDAAA
ncbi:hypothetical protein [Rhodococcus sp. UFZ-B548]|uniref:hypothetical protein n=1 Tax=Rhodococcus sp. UFZ-B548 TaxID=2742212 RepID=UPI0015F6F9EA|nr:hypothetical protein [Rhodococcus sp. UFZ-B548]